MPRPAGPRLPAYRTPQPEQLTDMLISEAWVATPSSPKSRVSSGYVRSL